MGEARHAGALPVVVKVGGSLTETGRLDGVLGKIARSRRAVVIVPGGGGFVDKVRDLQRAIGFGDAEAHRLAMLGMHQMAEVFLALQPRFAAADSLAQIASVIAAGSIPVWLPLPMCEDDAAIPADWSITSDGLAARLAERLGGASVVLVKSLSVERAATAEALADDGVVDRAFAAIVGRAAIAWRVVGPDDDRLFDEVLGLAPALKGNS